MIRHLFIGLTLVIGATAPSCTSVPVSKLRADPALAELFFMQSSDPATALDHAWRRGDVRFLGIAGFSLEVPGVEDAVYEAVRSHGIREIPGTEDTNTDGDRWKLVSGARGYIERYNELLLQRLGGAASLKAKYPDTK
jgi:hypothetical protein